MNVILPPGYMQATKTLAAALEAELEALKRAKASGSGEDWDKLVVAHNAAVAAADAVTEMEPQW